MSRLATAPRRNRFVIPGLRRGRLYRTVGSPPVALHPALRRRSYLQLLGCDQPRHGLAPCRQSVLTDAQMVGEGRPSADFVISTPQPTDSLPAPAMTLRNGCVLNNGASQHTLR